METGRRHWAARSGAAGIGRGSAWFRKGLASQRDLLHELRGLVIFDQQHLFAVLVHPGAPQVDFGCLVWGEQDVLVRRVLSVFELARAQVAAEVIVAPR